MLTFYQKDKQKLRIEFRHLGKRRAALLWSVVWRDLGIFAARSLPSVRMVFMSWNIWKKLGFLYRWSARDDININNFPFVNLSHQPSVYHLQICIWHSSYSSEEIAILFVLTGDIKKHSKNSKKCLWKSQSRESFHTNRGACYPEMSPECRPSRFEFHPEQQRKPYETRDQKFTIPIALKKR